jgi:hypothetical protein
LTGSSRSRTIVSSRARGFSPCPLRRTIALISCQSARRPLQPQAVTIFGSVFESSRPSCVRPHHKGFKGAKSPGPSKNSSAPGVAAPAHAQSPHSRGRRVRGHAPLSPTRTNPSRQIAPQPPHGPRRPGHARLLRADARLQHEARTETTLAHAFRQSNHQSLRAKPGGTSA